MLTALRRDASRVLARFARWIAPAPAADPAAPLRERMQTIRAERAARAPSVFPGHTGTARALFANAMKGRHEPPTRT